jgi:hypothetical protein
MPRSRATVLRSLLAYELPIEPTLAELAAFGWDAEEPSAQLSPEHIVKVLERYLSGTLTAEQVTDWADLVECREDIGTEENEGSLNEIIFRLANPNLSEAVTHSVAREILKELRAKPTAA